MKDSQVKATFEHQSPVSIITDVSAKLSPFPKSLALAGSLYKSLFDEQHGEELYEILLPCYTNGKQSETLQIYLVKSFYSSQGTNI